MVKQIVPAPHCANKEDKHHIEQDGYMTYKCTVCKEIFYMISATVLEESGVVVKPRQPGKPN